MLLTCILTNSITCWEHRRPHWLIRKNKYCRIPFKCNTCTSETHDSLEHRRSSLSSRGPTQNTLWRSPSPKQSGEAKVTNLHNALTAIDEDVVTFEVPMNDGWCMPMKVDLQEHDNTNLQTNNLQYK